MLGNLSDCGRRFSIYKSWATFEMSLQLGDIERGAFCLKGFAPYTRTRLASPSLGILPPFARSKTLQPFVSFSLIPNLKPLVQGASAAALAALERDKAEAEASLRQQLLADYEAKVAELLDALRAMEEHVASETDATSRKLTEQVEAHGREMERLEGLLEKSQLKVEGLEKACKDSKNERERERDDAQFVKSTLAARDAEVELLRGEVETIQKEVEKLSEERTVRTREERIRTEEASALRVELSAREAEVARLAEMLENARAQNEGLGFGAARNEGLGFAAAKRSARDGVLDFGAAGGSAEGCGDLGADGFALVRKLAAENEVLRRRLSSAEATVSNPTLNLAPNPASNPGDLPERRLTHEAPQKSRIVRPYSRGDVRTVSGFTDGEEEARTGEYGQREVFQGTGLGTGLERLGLNERGFVTDSCLPEGIQTDTSRLFSPAVLQLQEEMQAVRRRVEALKPSHVAAAAAPGLEVIQNELLQLKAVVQSLAAPDSAQWKSGTPERSDSTREAGRVGNQAGERAAQTDAVTLNVLQEMKENVASLRGELDSLQRAAAVQRVDTPFASPVAGSVGGFRTGVDIGRLSEPAEGFAGGFGESPIALTERVGHYGREPSGVHQQMTPAGTAADVAALQESVLQLTRELLEMRSAAAPVGSNSASGFASAQGPPQLLTSGEAEKGNGGGQVFAAEKGAHSTKGEGARNDLSGAERNRIGRNGSALVPSELLQREIADARAELAALRSGSKGFPVSGTNRNGPESGGGHVSERAEAGEERRSLVRWVDANLTGSVEPAGSDCGEAAATGNSSWGRFLGEAGGIPSAPLLTWTDLATCLEQSENVPGSGSFVSARAVIGGGVRSGASVQVAQRFESSDAKYASATTYTTSNASGNGRKWGQSSVTLPLRASKPAVKVVPRTGANGPVVDRKEKQNKVGYAPKMTWASPASVFQVVSK